jgi:hypothetical protein
MYGILKLAARVAVEGAGIYAVTKVLEKLQVAERVSAFVEEQLTNIAFPFPKGAAVAPEPGQPTDREYADSGYTPRFGGDA